VPDHETSTLKELQLRVAAIDAEVGGAPRLDVRDPNRLPLNRRLHDLENDRASALAAQALKEMQERSWRHGWSLTHTIVLLVFAVVTLTLNTLGLILK